MPLPSKASVGLQGLDVVTCVWGTLFCLPHQPFQLAPFPCPSQDSAWAPEGQQEGVSAPTIVCPLPPVVSTIKSWLDLLLAEVDPMD